MYLHISDSIEAHRRVVPVVVKACISYIAVYAFELFFSIEIFEKIKRESLTLKNMGLMNFQVNKLDFFDINHGYHY